MPNLLFSQLLNTAKYKLQKYKLYLFHMPNELSKCKGLDYIPFEISRPSFGYLLHIFGHTNISSSVLTLQTQNCVVSLEIQGQ